MEEKQLKKVVEIFEQYCIERQLSFVIVGSVGYREGLSCEGQVPCDDLDCVIIYNQLNQLRNCPFLQQDFKNVALKAVRQGDVDLFATKFILEEVKVSLDFISVKYFDQLAQTRFTKEEVFFRKMTDAVENPTNTYFDFYNQQYTYHKRTTPYGIYTVYHLPVYLHHNGSLFAGVLYNKFLFNPIFVVVSNECIVNMYNRLQTSFVTYYKLQKEVNEAAYYPYAMRNWELFPKNSQQRVHQLFQSSTKQYI